MAASIGVRGDYSASDLRRVTRRCGDAYQVLRLVAMASILDVGGGREAHLIRMAR